MTQSERALNSKTFCMYPWIHQYVGPMGDVKPCCAYLQEQSIGDFKKNTLKEIWNNTETKQMRLDMLNGIEIPGCEKCNSRNELSLNERNEINRRFFSSNIDLINSTKDDGTVETHELQYIDARFNNLCNLKCRTCGPRFSTAWHEDHVKSKQPDDQRPDPNKEAFQFPGKTETQLLDEIIPHLPYAKHIYFAGGEPLMQSEHYDVLEELIRIGHTDNLTIVYNTNFTNLKLGKRSVLDLWPKFKNINVNASLDGNHKRAEYWRKGTKWDTIVSNRKELIEKCPNVKFLISFTLSWPNAHNLTEFHKEWVELGLIGINDIMTNLLDYPVCYSLKNLPLWKKNILEEQFLDQIEWLKENKSHPFTIGRYEDAIKFMYSVETGNDFAYHGELFDHLTTFYDKIRDENFWEVFPEHNDMRIFLNK